MAFQPTGPGIYYNPPQPTQLVPKFFPPGPANPPIKSACLSTVIGLAISLNPYPSWSAQVQCKETSNQRVLETVPAQPLNPPTRQPDKQAIPLNPYPTWGSQRAPLNAYPPQAVAPPEPPNQAPIGQWSSPTWGTQYLPQIRDNSFRSPWFQTPLNYEVVQSWPQPNWGTQTLPVLTPSYVLPWFLEPLDYSVVGQWLAPTWGTQTLPVEIPPQQPPIWSPAPLQYELIGNWPLPTWGAQTLSNTTDNPGPRSPLATLGDQWPVHWPMPPLSQAQLKKYLESQRRAVTRRAKQIAAQVQYEQDLRETVERAIRGEETIEEVIEQAAAKPVPVSFKKADPNHVAFLARKLLERLPKPQDLKVQLPDLSQYQTPAAKVLAALPDDPEQADLEDLHELQSLYAQDFYERLHALQRLKRGKLN